MEKDKPPQLVTPASVKAIISRIEAAQLTRAQENISSQLSEILDNVNCVINRFQEELGYDLKKKAKPPQPEQKGKNRFILLEKISSFSKDAKTKEKHLYEILHWLGDWGDSLTYEIKNRKSEEEEEALDEWIEVMEKVLPLSLIATKGGIESLISLCSTLIEGQRKGAQMSKHAFWQDWQEQSPQKAISCPQPLSPEQMLQDKHTTCLKVSEVKSMLQELLDSTMFNQGEVRAIRYMSAVVENLNKALILQHKENRSLEAKYWHLKIEMTKELSNQKLYFQKSLQILESKRDALLKQIGILGGKYHDLLLIKHALEFQLKKIQSAGGQAEDLVRVLVEFPDAAKKEAFPKKDTVMEETHQEPKKEEQFSLHSPSPIAMAWDSGAMPSPDQPLSTMTMDSRIADVYRSKDAESLQPVLPSSMDHMFPKKWERLSAESPGDRAEDQKDFFQEVAWEKEGLQTKSHFQKQLSLERSRKLALESKAEAREEKLSWERRRQQWQQEEEMWLQRQERWALLEQEHEEKLRQWEAEEAAREQRLRLDQEPRGPWRELEQPGEDAERMIFVPISRWRDSEDASLAPPPSRAQSAHQDRRPRVPRSPKTQQPTPRNQRSMSSAEFTQKPQAHRLPTKPKKSASFPVTGASPRRVTQPPVHIAPVTLKEKVYHMNMEAQRRNLQLLTEKDMLGLPYCLHSKVLELTTTTMELNALKLWCLCHKYICYRHFQSLRQDVINHIQVVREAGASYKAQNLFLSLENVDHLQKLQLQVWTDKQKDLEEKRRECLSSMATMFPKGCLQFPVLFPLLPRPEKHRVLMASSDSESAKMGQELQKEWNVNLHTPVVISPKSRKSKPPPFLLRHSHSSSPFCKRSQELFKTKHQPRVPQQMARQHGNQMEAMWKIDVAASSYPIEKKTPASLSWDQLGGFPDTPRLLALDVQSSFHKSLMSLKARASVTQRKEKQEPPEESAELVHKKSSESFPGTLRSQKDQDNPSPIPCLSQ